jgi:hypothetical protein
MSDPRAETQANPHPVSQHRTPSEIAQDEAGPIGQPDKDVVNVVNVVTKGAGGENSPPSSSAKTPRRAVTTKRPGKRG